MLNLPPFCGRVLLILLVLPSFLFGQWEDVSLDHLMPVSTAGSWFGCGISTADFDGDGWDDVTASSVDGRVSLYKGGPDGLSFHQELTHGEEAKAVLWVDIDNDGDLDLFAGVMHHGVHLYMQQADGSLIEEGAARGIPMIPDWDVRGLSACDYDNDADLDIYIASYHATDSPLLQENILLQNQGDGTFLDVTAFAGVGNGLKHSFQGAWFDFDEDGFDDLWVINDRSIYVNALYRNLGDGSFHDISFDVGAAIGIEAMSATLMDYDNDGDWDMYVSNIENSPNQLLRNNNGLYSDVASQLGVASNQYSWGCCALDVDGDMDSDLMVATYRFPNANPYDNHLYMNLGEGTGFEDQIESWPNEQYQLYCLGRFDLDGDRAPDIVGHGNAAHAQVLNNTNPDGASRLSVNLVGTLSNSHAVGAVIKVYSGGIQQMRLVSAGCDYMTQHSYTQFFGLGDAVMVDSMAIEWPSGLQEMLYDVPADAPLSVIEGAASLELEPLDMVCPWHSMGWGLPFDTDNVTYLWNGLPVEGDQLIADSSGIHVLEISWWGGLYTLSHALQVELPAAPESSWALMAPNCAGDSGVFEWSAPSANHLIWGQDSLANQGAEFALPSGNHSMQFDYGGGCIHGFDVFVASPTPVGMTCDLAQPECFGELGQATIVTTGGHPPLTLDYGTANLDSLYPGVLSLTVTDTLGCSAFLEVVVVEPELLTASSWYEYAGLSDSVVVGLNVAGGTAPYNLMWSGPVDEAGSVMAPAALAWLVQDAQGCLVMGTLTVSVNTAQSVVQISDLPWTCFRQGRGLIWQGNCAQIERISAFDRSGRQFMDAPFEHEVGEQMDLGMIGPVLLRVQLFDGRVVVLSR